MALTEAGLCNLALLRVGQRQFITALTQNSPQAQLCALAYPHARGVVLEAAWWPFATRRAELALLSGTTRSGWEYAYALPADCLTARYIYSGVRNPAPGEGPPFTTEDDETSGRILLTDEEEPELVYTTDSVVAGRFPSLFCDALVARLAIELAFSLPVKPQLALGLEPVYRQALNVALAAQHRQAKADAAPEGESVRARS